MNVIKCNMRYTVMHAHTHTPLSGYAVVDNMNENSIYMNEIRRSLYVALQLMCDCITSKPCTSYRYRCTKQEGET